MLVTDIIPDAKVKSAMNDINAAQREQVAANARGEAEKILVVKKAEAEAESKALQGQGIANQRRAIIEGLRGSIEEFQKAVGGASAQEVMQLVLVTQYFDTLKSIGESDKTNTLFLSHTPGAVQSISEQIMQSMMATQNAKSLRSVCVRWDFALNPRPQWLPSGINREQGANPWLPPQLSAGEFGASHDHWTCPVRSARGNDPRARRPAIARSGRGCSGETGVALSGIRGIYARIQSPGVRRTRARKAHLHFRRPGPGQYRASGSGPSRCSPRQAGPARLRRAGLYISACAMRFDADHIAAIDNSTRKLMQEGQRRSPSACSSRSVIRRSSS